MKKDLFKNQTTPFPVITLESYPEIYAALRDAKIIRFAKFPDRKSLAKYRLGIERIRELLEELSGSPQTSVQLEEILEIFQEANTAYQKAYDKIGNHLTLLD